MSASTRLTLEIDVFEKGGQHALVLPDLKPPELIAAILQEFRELEYLGNATAQYRLVKLSDGAPLDDEAPLSSQTTDGEHLALAEVDVALPDGTAPPAGHIYLREQATGAAYRIAWQPAIIGRTSENLPGNDLVAVDLKALPTGLRISRRHARLTEEEGRYYVENLSTNPVSLVPASPARDSQEGVIPLVEGRHRLYPGDLLKFERSDIMLKFVIRPEAARAAVDAARLAEGMGSAA